MIWMLLHSGAAAFLFGATCATFDRCLGRISETSEREGSPISAKKPPQPFDPDGDDELLDEEAFRPADPLHSQLESQHLPHSPDGDHAQRP